MDDLISRQMAIDALWEKREMLDSLMDEFLNKGMPIMRSNTKIERNRVENDIFIINQLPSVQSEQQWIPCSERLPDKDGKYLVSGNWEGKEEVTICGFYTELGRFGASWRFTIKAWMPLPEPYKGGDE